MPPDGYEHLLETQDARRVAWILALVPEKNPGASVIFRGDLRMVDGIQKMNIREIRGALSITHANMIEHANEYHHCRNYH